MTRQSGARLQGPGSAAQAQAGMHDTRRTAHRAREQGRTVAAAAAALAAVAAAACEHDSEVIGQGSQNTQVKPWRVPPRFDAALPDSVRSALYTCQRPAQRGSNCSNQRVQAPQLLDERVESRAAKQGVQPSRSVSLEHSAAAEAHRSFRRRHSPLHHTRRRLPCNTASRPAAMYIQGDAKARHPRQGTGACCRPHSAQRSRKIVKIGNAKAQWPTVAATATAAAAVGPTTAAAAAEAAATAAAAAVVLARGACTQPIKVQVCPEQPALTCKLTARARAAAVKIRAPYTSGACFHNWLLAITRAAQ